MLVANSTLGKAHNTTCSSAPKYAVVYNIQCTAVVSTYSDRHLYHSNGNVAFHTQRQQHLQAAAFAHSDNNIYTTTVDTAKFLLLCINVAVAVCKC